MPLAGLQAEAGHGAGCAVALSQARHLDSGPYCW